jgi:hypothetical protein
LPAGLGGSRIPALNWVAWCIVLTASLATLYLRSGSFAKAVRTLAWLLPPVVLLTVPVAVFAVTGRGIGVAAALVLRAMAAAAAGLATVAILGPAGLIAGLRSLHVPSRLLEIVHAMLVSLNAIVRQVAGMLRARAARRTGPAPWSTLVVAPIETLRGFGRLVGALLLRSMERAESTERARRARGGFEG